MLYPLSDRRAEMVLKVGLEPTPYGLQNRCSAN